MINKSYKRIIQIELNEISNSVIEDLIAKNKLPTFKRIKEDWKYFKTSSETEYDKLEPWIQWVTAHTGKTYAEHQIGHLSDVHQLQHLQIWEELSKHGIESGIIGSMNTLRRNTKGGIFFSDPWSQQNNTYPTDLRPLWELISAKVQGHTSSKMTSDEIIGGMKACWQLRLPPTLLLKIANQIVSQKINKLKKWRLAGIFDLFLTEIFKRILKTTDFGYYTLFLNSVAHYQHHYWRNFDRSSFNAAINYPDIGINDDPITYGYEIYDKILGDLFKKVGNDPDTLIIILSGLSQTPYTAKEQQGGMNYYRLKDHKFFATMIGLKEGFKIFPLMSRDWQIQYKDEISRQKALKLLSRLQIKGEPLFNIKENVEGYIFLETKFYKGVSSDDLIYTKSGDPIGKFLELFNNIAIKSGHHTGIGHLWLSESNYPPAKGIKTIPLTDVYPLTLNALGIKQKQQALVESL